MVALPQKCSASWLWNTRPRVKFDDRCSRICVCVFTERQLLLNRGTNLMLLVIRWNCWVHFHNAFADKPRLLAFLRHLIYETSQCSMSIVFKIVWGYYPPTFAFVRHTMLSHESNLMGLTIRWNQSRILAQHSLLASAVMFQAFQCLKTLCKHCAGFKSHFTHVRWGSQIYSHVYFHKVGDNNSSWAFVTWVVPTLQYTMLKTLQYKCLSETEVLFSLLRLCC